MMIKKKLPIMLVLIMVLQIIMPITTVIWESDFTVKSLGATTLEATDSNGITWTYGLEDGNAINVKPKDKDSLPTEVTIPEKLAGYSVTSIGECAFFWCTSLTSIKIPDSVTSIGYSAFRKCTSLTSIKIPDSVTSIESWAFGYCTRLTSIEIPDGVTSIGYSAFAGCTSLTSIKIPDSVTRIESYVFDDCDKVTIVCNKGSYAENYAKNNEIKYEYFGIVGDANGDGKINFNDILTINKHRLGKAELTGAKFFSADVNNDGVVDFKDMLKINKYRLGKIDSL